MLFRSVPAIEVARSRFFERQLLEGEVATLEARLEARKIVERAKGILMQTQGMSESDAFTWIQRSAMNQRKSMTAVAQALLDAPSA